MSISPIREVLSEVNQSHQDNSNPKFYIKIEGGSFSKTTDKREASPMFEVAKHIYDHLSCIEINRRDKDVKALSKEIVNISDRYKDQNSGLLTSIFRAVLFFFRPSLKKKHEEALSYLENAKNLLGVQLNEKAERIIRDNLAEHVGVNFSEKARVYHKGAPDISFASLTEFEGKDIDYGQLHVATQRLVTQQKGEKWGEFVADELMGVMQYPDQEIYTLEGLRLILRERLLKNNVKKEMMSKEEFEAIAKYDPLMAAAKPEKWRDGIEKQIIYTRVPEKDFEQEVEAVLGKLFSNEDAVDILDKFLPVSRKVVVMEEDDEFDIEEDARYY